jgi:hypothetical protein
MIDLKGYYKPFPGQIVPAFAACKTRLENSMRTVSRNGVLFNEFLMQVRAP